MENLHINWFPGHMKKTIDEIKLKIKAFDLVVQIVDARCPISTTNPVVQELVKKYNITCLTILNKCDLANAIVNKEWVAYYRQQGQLVFLLNSQIKIQKQRFWREINSGLADKIERLRNKGIVSPQLKMIVVGVPNVGKSTFINNILHKRKAGVGNMPGFTKGQQLFKVAENWLMMDTPGILWPKVASNEQQLNLALVHAINPNVIPLELTTAYGLNKITILSPEYTKYYYNHEWVVSDAPLVELNNLCKKVFVNKTMTESCKNILFNISNQDHFRISLERPEN